MTMSLTLYSDRFWISPFVFSCYVTLKEKGVPFDLVELALDKQETRKPDYVAHTLTAKVPALEHDGFWLAESSAIIEYLDEQFPSPRVLPADSRQRARARQIMAWLRTDMDPLRRDRPTTVMFYEKSTQPPADDTRGCIERLYRVATALVPNGATSLFGEWSIADSELAFMLQRLGLNGDALPPSLHAFVEAQWSRPSVKGYLAHPRAPYVPYG
jgi:glutathione S-transferase